MSNHNLGLRRLIAPMLESIDAIQSNDGKPIYIRPFEAAGLIVRYSIVQIEGDDDKDNYIKKPWFAAIYREIHKWYESKYGSLMEVQRDNVTGLIVHNGLPHVIDIPKTISVLQDSGLVKLTFPSKLHAGENPMTWVRPRIPKRSIGNSSGKLDRRIASTCNALRRIGINTLSAGGESSGVPLMAGSIVEHLSNAATIVSSHHKEGNSLAIWDIHLACEKSIKSLLTQRDISYPKTHDLLKLNLLLADPLLEHNALRIIRLLPDDKVVIGHRYLQETTISTNRFYTYYSLAMKLCVLYTSNLAQEIQIADASFFLKRPPWFSQLV